MRRAILTIVCLAGAGCRSTHPRLEDRNTGMAVEPHVTTDYNQASIADYFSSLCDEPSARCRILERILPMTPFDAPNHHVDGMESNIFRIHVHQPIELATPKRHPWTQLLGTTVLAYALALGVAIGLSAWMDA